MNYLELNFVDYQNQIIEKYCDKILFFSSQQITICNKSTPLSSSNQKYLNLNCTIIGD